MTPLAIEVALTVRQELASRHEEADRLRRRHVERARYEAAAAQEAYEKAKAADAGVVTDAERAELMALATDFPRLWRDPRTQMKEKKRMLRLLIEDVRRLAIII